MFEKLISRGVKRGGDGGTGGMSIRHLRVLSSKNPLLFNFCKKHWSWLSRSFVGSMVSCLNLLSSFSNSCIFNLYVILSIITTPLPLSGRSMTMPLFVEDSVFFQSCSCLFVVAIVLIAKVRQVRSLGAFFISAF